MRESPQSHDASRWIFWAAAWLAVMFVACKGWYLGATTFSLVGAHDFGRWVAAISYPDVVCAAILWAASRIVIAVAPARMRSAAVVCMLVLAAACAAYA